MSKGFGGCNHDLEDLMMNSLPPTTVYVRRILVAEKTDTSGLKFVESSIGKPLEAWAAGDRNQKRLQRLFFSGFETEPRADLGLAEGGRRGLAAHLCLNWGSSVLIYFIYCTFG